MDFAMRILWTIVIAAMIGFLSPEPLAAGRTMRCANRLVEVGDYQSEVVAKCGDPQKVETFENQPGEWVSKFSEDDYGRFKAPYLLKSPINKEVWTYQLGTNRLPYVLYFYEGRLTRLEIGRRHE